MIDITILSRLFRAMANELEAMEREQKRDDELRTLVGERSNNGCSCKQDN